LPVYLGSEDGLEMAAVLLALSLRPRGFAASLAAKLAPTSETKDLLDILGQYMVQRTLGQDRLVEATRVQNNRALKFCTDLNRYTLADVMGQAGAWLYQTDGLNKKMSEADVVSLLRSGPLRNGYIQMAPHIAAALTNLGRHFPGGGQHAAAAAGEEDEIVSDTFEVSDDGDAFLENVREHCVWPR